MVCAVWLGPSARFLIGRREQPAPKGQPMLSVGTAVQTGPSCRGDIDLVTYLQLDDFAVDCSHMRCTCQQVAARASVSSWTSARNSTRLGSRSICSRAVIVGDTTAIQTRWSRDLQPGGQGVRGYA